MNKYNFPGHLALALTVILLAGLAGQIRRWQREWPSAPRAEVQRNTRDYPAMSGADEAIVRNEEVGEAEVLVRFRSGTTAETVERITARLNDAVEDRIESVSNLHAIDDLDGLDAQTVAEQYRQLPEVEYAEPNFRIDLDPEPRRVNDSPRSAYMSELLLQQHVSPNDPMFYDQWSLANTGQREGKAKADIRALNAWSKTKGSDEVVVAVLDSGVDYTHPDLKSNIWVRPAGVASYSDDQLGEINDEHGFNAVEASGDPMDENGHGTHCAGIIGAEGGNNIGIVGVNWHVQIMPLKFMSAGGFGTTKAAIECINYVIDRKQAGVNVRIISASWGSTMKSRALEDAIRKAGEEGILFVAASGNASTNADKTPHYPASYRLPNVLSVAALNRRDELASFSNYGVKSVHIAAPGAEILSTWLGSAYEEHSGTSMATPEVAGVAALVLAVNPKLSVGDLRERLLDSVDPLDNLRDKVMSGGRLNAARAVKAN